ncbi:ABC transporter permease [Oharaeibacter diazotrophicus]|uniref:Nucleoside ABC transporter membrane protein n=1 Tax=Oharaeibacter diazotrophicus TaxID=1920512 RepID=A0A4R6RKM9_9HYPH|nr:ABC transporter permease [Oharaeibacter diazotrophicus]TDP87044.1 nucleoside ABC transporter membrane protein [Oharaeibacter diazotrophicus]BBE71013.1 branched-chain amino acid transport system /permease component [Pleomorphomonas sp. SM30]GLS77763.1 ABC transporter permease [Oharaeibacter diazotrophicus]
MRVELVKRPEMSRTMMLVSPLIAVGLTVVVAAAVFAVQGFDPLQGLWLFFLEPLTSLWGLEQLITKATPLVIVALGLSVCYLSNNWNIGAEGQLTIGAIVGSIPPVLFPHFVSPLVLPLMLILAAAGGAAYASVPALLKTRFGTNEILTSLMLVYCSTLFLDWLVRGPWRSPQGYNFPITIDFNESAILNPWSIGGVYVNLSAFVALALVAILAVVMRSTLKGFEIRVLGQSPRAGAFAGFSHRRMTLFAFALSGAFAGLAGMMVVMAEIQKLQPVISPGYGFTAIIVAFLGRLNPVGILVAGLVIASSYLGGEAIQTSLQMSSKVATLIQGVLLFFVLACDTLILYRVRLVGGPSRETARA